MTCLAAEQDVVARMSRVLMDTRAPLDESLCSRLQARAQLIEACFSRPAINMYFEAACERARRMGQ